MIEIKKFLAVSIILLFLGVAVAPTINQRVVKASTNDNLVEVTTQACGIQGYRDSTVTLTREQYQNLEEYFVEFRIRLNQTSTREEAVPLFKEAVMELDKYGLLPKGMSVERVQKLVIGGYQKLSRFLKSINLGYYQTLSDDVNLLCLIAGETSVTYVSKFPLCSFFTIVYHIVQSEYNPLLLFLYLCFYIRNSLPIQLGSVIFLGGSGLFSWCDPGPASGWIHTIGLNGKKSWNGYVYGNLPAYHIFLDFILNGYYPGVLRFTGIHTGHDEDHFYLGSALWVKVSAEPVESHNLRSSEIVKMMPKEK